MFNLHQNKYELYFYFLLFAVYCVIRFIKIKVDDIRRIRPGMGLAPKFYQKILGKKLLKKVVKGQAVSFQDFE